MKNKTIAFLVFFGFVGFLSLEKPLKILLINLEVEKLEATFVSGILLRIVLLVILIFIIKKLKLFEFTGLTGKVKIYNIQSIWIALAFIGIGIKINWNDYTSVEPFILFLYFLSVMTVGFIEEFVFRGTIFPLFIKSFHRNRKVLLISAIGSSLMFGIIHYINLFSNPSNFIGITSQVFLAFSLGMFFSGLMLRTGNILMPAILHGLINFAFGTGDLAGEMIKSSSEVETFSVNWSSIIPTSIFFFFIMVGGLYMIKQSKKEIGNLAQLLSWDKG